MARYTNREFTEAVGLGSDRDAVIRSGIILKTLCGIGLAKEVGKRQGGTGRPAIVYDVDDLVVQASNRQRASVQEPVAVHEPVAQAGFYYDDDDED